MPGINSKFAESQLKKYGWSKGDGLGKHKQGIKKAISVGIKNDTNGLGKDTNSWGFAWWDHVYNKSAANMSIEKSEDGEVKITKTDSSKEKQKKALYGAFVKKDEGGNDDKKDYSIKISDEELFKACEGRTARKGAIYDQSGKYERVDPEKLLGVEMKKKSEAEDIYNINKQKDKKDKSKKDKKDKKHKKEGKEDKKEKKHKKDKKDKKDKKEKKDNSSKKRKSESSDSDSKKSKKHKN
ncbi:hypothetical protein BCR32DRAFT_294414 [Anaeromyces robustus]|uniref:G-patch domain-containing protein n=1 Tax=Anaeromyces robustus TaxID=1754192 RepID=A0A1Y1X116_9FUNG|nr:hypothetical protein BCR32DRAFT_294414 [Anaeromyces robustus]|eukprot:ORX79500.1 hypothetical protein BCR32DRAFT_294414 [Anaeromyces robustus]